MQGKLTILHGALILLGAFVLLWIGGLWFTAWAGGWRRLAERFGNPPSFEGEVTPASSARIRFFFLYKGTLDLGVSEMGLYLAPRRLYRLFHPPLLIPWTEIQAEMRGRGMWAWSGLHLTFPSVANTTITFYSRELDIVLPYVSDESAPSG